MEKMEKNLETFEQELRKQEKSRNTIEKYIRDTKRFLDFLDGREPDQEIVIRYKESLQDTYRVSSVNSMVIAVNSYLHHIGRDDCRVRTCRVQRRMFREEERELSKKEYRRLVMEADKAGKNRLCCILQTIASTGIRIGELKYITVEALKERMVRIDFKGKARTIILPRVLVIVLKDYCRNMGIKRGVIFLTKNGKPVDRRTVWREMKEICGGARVMASKVFPHNLRHLFALCFYEKEKDLTRLADYLGHSSVETTRRYTMISSAEACERQLDLGLLMADMGEIKEGT